MGLHEVQQVSPKRIDQSSYYHLKPQYNDYLAAEAKKHLHLFQHCT